jgi:diguanylate cyclase (GGDEF)-like protein
VAERRYFNEAISGKQTLSDPIESKKDGSTCVVLGVPIYENGDKSGKIIGVLGGSYNISALSQTLFNNYFDGSGYFLMVNQDGEVMFTDNSIDYNESSAVNVPIEKLKDNFAAQEYGQLKFEDNGREYYLVYAPFETNNWSVCYCIPVSKAKEAYHFITKYEVILAVYLIVVVISLTLWIMVRNIQKERQIIRNSKIDALTGAQNKKSTQDSIEEWFTNEDCHGLQAFLMFDVDKFKQVNDEHGHIAGDAALRQIGNLLKSYFRNDDIIGRIGGDEFVVMMKNVSSIEDAVHRAENLQLRMHSMEIPELGGAHITCSMGLSFYPNNGSTYMELYSRADSALYISKERGRNTCTIYGDAPHDSYNI